MFVFPYLSCGTTRSANAVSNRLLSKWNDFLLMAFIFAAAYLLNRRLDEIDKKKTFKLVHLTYFFAFLIVFAFTILRFKTRALF